MTEGATPRRGVDWSWKEGVDIVFVAGGEYTIFNRGLYPGDTLGKRIQWLGAQFGSHWISVGRTWSLTGTR